MQTFNSVIDFERFRSLSLKLRRTDPGDPPPVSCDLFAVSCPQSGKHDEAGAEELQPKMQVINNQCIRNLASM